MPGGGIEAARGIRRTSPDTAILALSASDERDCVLGMLEAGAVGYLAKGTPGADLIDGIHRALRHQPTLSGVATDHVVRALGDELRRQRETANLAADRAARIRQVLDGANLRMVFQPVHHLHSGGVVGYEALARFAGPGDSSPLTWFADAAATGQLVDLEMCAISQALGALPRIDAPQYLAVNASPETIASPQLANALAAVPPVEWCWK